MHQEASVIKSFNSPLHLSWTDKTSYLSNGCMWQLKNSKGESIIRYWIWFLKNAIEIQQINLAWWEIAYKINICNNKIFEWDPIESRFVNLESEEIKDIQINWILKFCFTFLTKIQNNE